MASTSPSALCDAEESYAKLQQGIEKWPWTIPTQQQMMANLEEYQKRSKNRITRTTDRETERIDPNFKIHGSRPFKWGKVFKVLWADPHGNNESTNFTKSQVHTKIRRSVIVPQDRGHSICLPIHTYASQGTTKGGVQSNDHRMIHTSTKCLDTKGRAGGHDSSGTNGYAVTNGDPKGTGETRTARSCSTTQSTQSQIVARIKRAPKTTAMLNSTSAFLMATSFLWLNKKMDLSQSSRGVNTITSTSITSPSIMHALDSIPTEVIFATFVLATAIFTGSAILWATNNAQTKGAKTLGLGITMTLLVLFFLVGFTAEELLLVCLPLSFSVGSGTSCLLGRFKSDLQHCSDCGYVHCDACEMGKDMVFEV